MSKETVEIMIEGGKAVAGPTVGQKLGPLGINIQQVLIKINEKTASFKGMKVPVKIIVETSDKSFNLEIGTPPTAELIKKELNLQKGSGVPNKLKTGNLGIEQVIKIAKMKQDSLFVDDLKAAVKTIVGTCNSLGILIEGKTAKDVVQDINKGKYDKEIKEEKTEVNPEKQKELEQQFKEIQKEMEKIIAVEKAKLEVKEEKKEESKEEKETKGKLPEKAKGKQPEKSKEKQPEKAKEETKPKKETKGKK